MPPTGLPGMPSDSGARGMTLREFTTWLTTTFPKAEWRIWIDANIHYSPAHVTRWFTGEKESIPVIYEQEVSYHLTFTRDYFDKGKTPADTFEAPSLVALQAILQAHYQHDASTVIAELEEGLHGTD